VDRGRQAAAECARRRQVGAGSGGAGATVSRGRSKRRPCRSGARVRRQAAAALHGPLTQSDFIMTGTPMRDSLADLFATLDLDVATLPADSGLPAHSPIDGSLLARVPLTSADA